MSDIELEGIYPFEDPSNLPIKVVNLGRANIFVKGFPDINEAMMHINGLADVNPEKERPITNIKFSVWEDSGAAHTLDRQLLIDGATLSLNPDAKHIHIFEPYEVRLWTIQEDLLPNLVKPDGYFWQVARFFGANGVKTTHLSGRDPEPSELEVSYEGIQRFEQPKRFQFGLSNKADLYVGDLKFSVSLTQPK